MLSHLKDISVCSTSRITFISHITSQFLYYNIYILMMYLTPYIYIIECLARHFLSNGYSKKKKTALSKDIIVFLTQPMLINWFVYIKNGLRSVLINLFNLYKFIKKDEISFIIETKSLCCRIWLIYYESILKPILKKAFKTKKL